MGVESNHTTSIKTSPLKIIQHSRSFYNKSKRKRFTKHVLLRGRLAENKKGSLLQSGSHKNTDLHSIKKLCVFFSATIQKKFKINPGCKEKWKFIKARACQKGKAD